MTTSSARALRTSLRLSVPMAVLGAALAAAPAMAATPANWPEVDEGSFMDHFLLIVAYPVGLALVIALLAFAPALLGKDKAKGGAGADGEWLGGPAGAEAGAEGTDSSRAGGASGKW